MRDSVAGISLAGFIGAAFVAGLSLVGRILGIPVMPIWEISALIFLKGGSSRTPSGIFLGLVATVALCITTSAIIYLLLRLTGRDFWWLKGVVGANAFTFVNMAFFMPLLGIAPFIRTDPTSHIIALILMTLLGLLQAGILTRWIRPAVHI